jgi:hypothetical protein
MRQHGLWQRKVPARCEYDISKHIFSPYIYHRVICALDSFTSSVQLLRSYSARSGLPSDATILELACATIAYPKIYNCVDVGEDLSCISSIVGCANPTTDVLREAQAAFGGEIQVSTILSIGAGNLDHKIIDKLVGSGLHSEMIKNSARNAEAIDQGLEKRLGSLAIYFRFNSNLTGLLKKDPRGVRSFTYQYLRDSVVNSKLNEALSNMRSRKGVSSIKDISK